MATFEFPWLTTLILFPLLAALPIPLIEAKEAKTIRFYALSVGLIDFALMVCAFWSGYNPQNPGLQLVERYSWLPQIGLDWSLAVDGLSMPLILLTGLITTLAILAAWDVKEKPRLFYFLMLVMYSAQIAVFAAQDLLFFFLVWELELVPVYLLISIWGGPKRTYAATKFILYTALASLFILVGAFAMAFYGDNFTFDMQALGLKQYTPGFEALLYLGFLVAFGVKLPIFPLHTWLPDAHSEAPAPVSMLLAGILLKMGGYALMRFNVEMLPHAHITFAPMLAILGVVNIVYGAFAAFAQTNMKRRIAFSSISHMGFVLLGIAAFNDLGMSGAMLQMVSHGLIAAALFFTTGIAYDRTHTLAMDKLGGIATKMPITFALFVAASMASLALPGMSGFVSELAVFLGFATDGIYSNSFRVVVIFLASVGLILTPIYLLSMVRRVFCGTQSFKFPELLQDAKPREVFVAACLLLPVIGIGFYPKLATQFHDVKTVALAAHVQELLPAGNDRLLAFRSQWSAWEGENTFPTPITVAEALAPTLGVLD
ncbi:NAD(P)H-quinone oxidoreductase subunit 4 [Prochlorothrix hollandica]|uniref:NAD(P)H-quinone oxidoreductase chain 4 n=1 Tax=Prochlorothrix hollandica PCC 9006 = CALU 1027 TaxID=317619 RepID=A0A0M2PVM4_PROHO|nr:NAD(P)H-quinone oxidoreductase subunit 4 [Prochlorothrix hollandica]KKI98411.1 NAD(P)H-quinone oxidoreductase subunit 4 [Prochlorothrix hollandica PCC 9006 = CALU 1027]